MTAKRASTMRAVVLTGHGGMEKLEYRTDWPVPEPGPGEALIRVGACGLNNTDVNTRTGWYSLEDAGGGEDGGWSGGAIRFPRVQGADVVGRVVETGPGADAGLVGRRVMVDTWLRDWSDPLNLDRMGYFGSERDGGFAEFATADARNLHPIESDLSDAELATFATSSMTAENMLRLAKVGPDDVVLVPGASGGVGSALIQLVRRRGARCVALCSPAKADGVRDVGPDAVLPREPEDLRAALRAAVGRDTVSVVADVVGGPYWPDLIDALERGGRYVAAGAVAGPVVRFDLRVFYLRDLSFFGATAPPPGVFANLVDYVRRKEVRPLLAATYPLAEFHEAQRAFLARRHVGNIVVAP